MIGKLENALNGDVYDIELDTPESGEFTGYTFTSPKTGDTVRVMSKKGETKDHAIQRVTKKHNVGGQS